MANAAMKNFRDDPLVAPSINQTELSVFPEVSIREFVDAPVVVFQTKRTIVVSGITKSVGPSKTVFVDGFN